MTCRSSNLAALLALLLAVGSANAAPSAADIATARALVVEGRKLRQAGEFAKAVEKLKGAFTLYRTPVTGHELALAHRDAGQLLEAREAALLVVKMPVESDEGKASETARAECATMVTELAPKIARVTLSIANVPAGTTPSVTIDGDAVLVVSEPRLINPGKHVAIVRAGATEQKVEFELAEGENRTVAIALPGPASAPAAAAPPPMPPPPAAPAPPATDKTTTIGWLTWTGVGVAGVGLVVGSIAGVSAIGKSNRLDEKCGGDARCPRSEADAIRSYDTTTTISTIGFIAAGVGVTLAVIDLATGATARKTTASAPVSLSIGPGSFGLRGSF